MQESVGGIGIILSAHACKALRKTNCHSEQIIFAEFESNPITTVIAEYSPTNTAVTEDIE